LAIAEEAGDAWAARARRSAQVLAGADDDEASLGVLLLADVRTALEDRQVERIATTDLIRTLAAFDESPWAAKWIGGDGEPTRGAPRRLAQLLRPFGIRSNTTVRIGGRTAKGYRREDFADAWERFLPSRVRESHQSHQSHPAPHGQTDVTDVPDLTDTRERPASHFCEACDDPERCAAELYCQMIRRLAAVSAAPT
jgi:hypothetical protein